MNFLCSIVIVLLAILNYSGAVVDSDAKEAKSILLSVLGSLRDSRNDDSRYGSQTRWDKYRGDQTGRRGGGGVVDDDLDDADLDTAISVLTKAVGDIDQGKTSVRLNNKPEVTSSLTQLTNNQEIPANVAAIIDSALSNSKDKIPDSVADLIKSASSKTTSFTNQDDQKDVARAYNSATGKTNKEFPANFADFFNSFPSTNVKSYNDVNSYNDVQVTSNTDDGSNVDVAKIMQDTFANAGDNKQGKLQKLLNGNYFKADTPSVQNYHDVKVSSSSSKTDVSNIDVNNILKNALGNAGNTGNAQSWQNKLKGDTPSVQNYNDVQVSTGDSDGSNVDVNKVIKDAIGNAGAPQPWQNSYKADTPSVQKYRDVKVSNINSNIGSGGSNVDVNKVIQDALASAGGAQKNTWQIFPSGNSVNLDTPSVQNYNDVQVSTGDSNVSNVDVSKVIKDAIRNAGGQQPWQNTYKADTPSVQTYRDVKVSNINSNTGSGDSNVDVNKVIQDALASAGGAQKAWQNIPSGNSVKVDNPSVQTYNEGSNVDVNKVIKETLASAGGAQKNTWQSSPSGNVVRVDNPSVQTYNDNKYSKPIANAKSDHSNTDVKKLIQDAFGKIENGQQSNNNKPNGQVSSTSDRQTYTNTKTEPKQVKSWRGSYTRAPNYGTTPGSSRGRNNAGQCLLRGELCKIGSGPECCGSDNAYGSKVPLCCTRIASGSGRSDFGLCQPKNPGMTCDRQ